MINVATTAIFIIVSIICYRLFGGKNTVCIHMQYDPKIHTRVTYALWLIRNVGNVKLISYFASRALLLLFSWLSLFLAPPFAPPQVFDASAAAERGIHVVSETALSNINCLRGHNWPILPICYGVLVLLNSYTPRILRAYCSQFKFNCTQFKLQLHSEHLAQC